MFSPKSAYQIFCCNSVPASAEAPLFKVWKWKGPNYIRTFLWKLIHGKLLTSVERNRRGMSTDVLCPRCNSSPETIMHILKDCDEASQFWNRVIKPEYWSKYFSIGVIPWLDWNLSSAEIGIAH